MWGCAGKSGTGVTSLQVLYITPTDQSPMPHTALRVRFTGYRLFKHVS
jgi:hypothetical protein